MSANRFLKTQNRLCSILARCVLLIAFALYGAGFAHTAENRLVAEFWAELQPTVRPDADFAARREAVVRQMLAEAQWTFSGMIYGYRFSYTPFDRRRGVEEQFTLEPIASIPWGDPELTVLATRQEGGRHLAQIQYVMVDHQARRHAAWQSRSVSRSAGTGQVSLWPGVEQKQLAVEDAVRMAVRERLRVMSPNKPAAAHGRVVLAAPPRIWILSGAYHASVHVRMDVDEIRHYELF
ncbi:MAG: hypothetical protein EA403_11695 [Spirochaetaceae bacterium]|nr:MAG: hypothetical protein EA403_11695 [Spirochaetaceae bacterium]